MPSRVIKFAVFASTLFSACSFANCYKDPEELTKALFNTGYQFYAWPVPAFADTIAPPLSTALQTEFKCKSEGELCAIDVDPWLMVQDGEAIKPFEFSVTTISQTSHITSFKFRLDLGAEKEIKVKTVQLFMTISSKGCMLINDFITSDGSSLVKWLNDWHAKNNSNK